jgi:hypothetical protein
MPVPDTAPLPRDIAGITPDWLTAALRPSGILPRGRVAAIRAIPIGMDESFTGGSLFRLALDHQGGTGPASVVAKLSPSDPVLAATMGPANRREVMFYRTFAKTAALPVPRCHFAEHDPDGPGSLILLEDLGHLRRVPFLDGCAEADARQVITALARLHAAHWNAPHLPPPVADPALSFSTCWARYPALAADILGEAALPARLLDLGDHIARKEAAILHVLHQSGPLTLIHRDAHADNILFGSPADPDPVILLDWQMTGSGRGIHDVGYFLISSVPVNERRRIENAMIAHYHTELQGLGIAQYTLDECRSDYLWSFVGKFWLTVIATVLLDHSTPHKRAWRRADLDRLIAFVQDHALTPASFAVT